MRSQWMLMVRLTLQVAPAASDFPTTPLAFRRTANAEDAFVTKLNATGTALAYSTLLGGNSNDEEGFAIAVSSIGEAYVLGYTSSTDFPLPVGTQSPAGFHDIFVVRLNATATALIYSTLLGGAQSELAGRIALDSAGAAYVTGTTYSTNFPTTANGFQRVFGGSSDAFVAKLDGSGAVTYSTFLGGSGEDEGLDIALSATGEIYVTGYTYSTNFPVTAGAYKTSLGGRDAFVTRLSSAGTLVYSTYFGGLNGYELGTGIAVDSSGAIYITGLSGPDTPVTCTAFQTVGSNDPYVTKLSADGLTVLYSTHLGSGGLTNNSASPSGIVVDSAGAIYVGGFVQSAFPTTAGAFQTVLKGPRDAFATKLIPVAPQPPASIVVAGGSPQSTAVNTPFGTPLQVRVTDAGGAPVGNYDMPFGALPSGSGASADVPLRAVTDCNGVATVNATANGIVGSYQVKAAANAPTSGQISATAGHAYRDHDGRCRALVARVGGSAHSARRPTMYQSAISRRDVR